MSMHEIEDLIESTIRTIDTLDIPSSEKRQLFANCYRAQAYFDTSYTHFRLMDILLKNDYMQTFRIHNFPLAKQYPEYYQALKAQDFEYIFEHPVNDQDDIEMLNEIVAVWDRDTDFIYVEFGTPYYALHSEAVVYEKALAAAKKIILLIHQSQPNLAYDWALFMIFYLLEEVEVGEADQMIQDYFADIQPIIAEIKADKEYLCLIEVFESENEERAEWLGETTKHILQYMKM
mgnify:CR=1 FL=1